MSHWFAIALALVGRPETQPSTQPAGSLQIAAGQQIVAIGDSITKAGGYLRAIEAVFAQQYPELKLPPIVNVGINGQKAEDLVARFEKDVIAAKPAIVTLSIGINDVWHRLNAPHDAAVLEAYGRNVERMVQMAQAAGIKVLLLAPTVIEEDANSEGNRRLVKYVDLGKTIARRRKCEYVDLHAMCLQALARRTATQPSSSPASTPTSGPVRFLTTDGVHMDVLGNVVMAIGVLRSLGVSDEKMMATDLSQAFPGGTAPAP
jgi:acyl-CoA thioesterase I